MQHLVGQSKSIGEFEIALFKAQEPIIGDHDLRVHMLTQLLQAGFSEVCLARALKAKRLGDDADRKDTHAFGNLRDHGGGTGPRSTAQGSSDEYHVCVLEQCLDLLGRLLRRLLAQRYLATGAQTMCDRLPDLQPHRCARRLDLLERRIDADKVDACDARVDHPPDSVGSAAAYADDLDAL